MEGMKTNDTKVRLDTSVTEEQFYELLASKRSHLGSRSDEADTLVAMKDGDVLCFEVDNSENQKKAFSKYQCLYKLVRRFVARDASYMYISRFPKLYVMEKNPAGIKAVNIEEEVK